MSSHELVNIENSRAEKRTVAPPRLGIVCEGSPPRFCATLKKNASFNKSFSKGDISVYISTDQFSAGMRSRNSEHKLLFVPKLTSKAWCARSTSVSELLK